MWPKGTLCITIAANIAKTGILNFDACFPDSVVGFTPHESVSSSVYVHFLFGFLQAILERNAPQAAQKNINLAILRTLDVPNPPFDLQVEFEAFVARAMNVFDTQGSSLEVMNTFFSSIQQRAFVGALDLSRLVLDLPDDAPLAREPEKADTKTAKPKAAALLLVAPEATEAALKILDDIASKGDPIPWSVDYFKYRILAVQSIPFSFGEVMQKAESVFEEPSYEEMKDTILELLEKGGGHAILSQSFDLHIDANTKEASGRKEIVFGPAQ
jgi:type I restriction enzyme S subunit